MNSEFCGCVSEKEFDKRQRVLDLWDEVVELFEVRSWDEFKDEWSDVVWGVGRLLGNLVGRAYIRIWGDELHVEKMKRRMQERGCVRSARHLVDGKCCSGNQGYKNPSY
jgi:hypothetical protein